MRLFEIRRYFKGLEEFSIFSRETQSDGILEPRRSGDRFVFSFSLAVKSNRCFNDEEDFIAGVADVLDRSIDLWRISQRLINRLT